MPGYTPESLNNALEAKGVKFNFKTGNVKYQAILHKDRSAYERVKAQSPSTPSSTSSTSSSESGSNDKAAK